MFLTRFIVSNIFCIFFIEIILLLKKLLKNNISLKFHYHIWFTLLFSLVIVFLPTAFFQSTELGSITQEITAPSNNVTENTIAAPDMPNDWRYDFAEMDDDSDQLGLNVVFVVIWAMGALGVIGYNYLGSRKLRTIKRFAECLPEDIISIFNDCCKNISVKRKVCLLQSDRITSPLCFGCRLPYIVLPSSVVQQSLKIEIQHILLHELMHIKHKDIWVNLWFCTEQIVYWFNPFIWWAFSKIRHDREAYCDWSVLSIYNTDEECLCYGDTLLQFAGQTNNTVVYAANSLFDNKKQIKYRIEKISNFKRETPKNRAIGHCLIIMLAILVSVQAPVFAAFASDFGLSYNPEQKINIIEQDYADLYGGASGCAIIYDMQKNDYNVYNPSAITTRIAPSSTCKIYSAINALEQGVITTSENILQWDYVSRAIPSWNENQSLNSAMKNSVSWYFQYLDNAVGADELEQFYMSIGYGNGYVGNDTAYYWNGSKLKVSPLEQIELLVRLYNNDFGFDDANVNAVKESIFISESDNNKLYGKTGTGRIGSDDISGWFVGYVETEGNTYFFAVNKQDKSNANGNSAINITHAIFKKMGIKINV